MGIGDDQSRGHVDVVNAVRVRGLSDYVCVRVLGVVCFGVWRVFSGVVRLYDGWAWVFVVCVVVAVCKLLQVGRMSRRVAMFGNLFVLCFKFLIF